MVNVDTLSNSGKVDFFTFLKGFSHEALPGRVAQQEMMMYTEGERVKRWNIPSHAQQSAVAVILKEAQNPQVLLLQRAAHLKHHPNQWAFPGGIQEKGESLKETALREAYEEVGIPPQALLYLNQLSKLYIPVSNFVVYPFVFALTKEIPLVLDTTEVQQYRWVVLADLPRCFKRYRRWYQNRWYIVPCWDIGDVVPLWGATAMMLNELLWLWRRYKMP